MSEFHSYDEALNFIKSKESLGIKPGLSRIKRDLNIINNPQNDYKIIHIAGTNGKGTVAATLSKALYNSGFNVGLFTSPWVIDYREQIQLNNEFISKEDFTSQAELIKSLNTNCTEFECLTIMAYNLFKEKKVDYAVIECGMGGKKDSTNVEKENLSVITRISLDHTDFLGNTIDDIAEEKSGILRNNCTCILYNSELRSYFENKCLKLVTDGLNDNLRLINATLNELGLNSVNELVRLPARQERIGNVLLDGGHNFSAAEYLQSKLNKEVAIIGMLRDKDVDAYLSVVGKKCKKIICVTPDNKRSITAAELAEIAKKYCSDVEICSNIIEAAKRKDVTLICGSFYLIRDIRNLLI